MRPAKGTRWLQALLEGSAGLLLFLLVVVGLLQVVGRYTFVVFMPWTEEIARLLFVWIIWVGAAAASIRGAHIRFDFLLIRAPARLRRGLDIAVDVGVALFLLVIVRYGFEVAQSQSNATFLTVNLSVKYTYLSAVVGSAIMLVGMAASLWKRRRRPEDHPGSPT